MAGYIIGITIFTVILIILLLWSEQLRSNMKSKYRYNMLVLQAYMSAAKKIIYKYNKLCAGSSTNYCSGLRSSIHIILSEIRDNLENEYGELIGFEDDMIKLKEMLAKIVSEGI